MNKNFIIWANIVIGIGFLLVGYYAYLLFYPFNPADINEVTMDKEYYQVGQPLGVLVDLCKNTDSPTKITYELESDDPTTFITLTTFRTGGQGGECRRFIDNSVIIPETVKPGIYKLHLIANYQVNHLRDIQYFFTTKEFEIIGL